MTSTDGAPPEYSESKIGASRRDCEEFLRVAYFGGRYLDDRMGACIQRAYLDFNRTLHTIAKLPEKAQLHETASDHVKMCIGNLRDAVTMN